MGIIMRSRKSGSLTRQIFRRIVILSLIALFSLLAVGGTGLLFIQMTAQRDLDHSGSKAARNIDSFMVDIVYDVRSISSTIPLTSTERVFQNMLDWHPGIIEMLHIDLQGKIVLEARRESGSIIISSEYVKEQPWLESIQAGNLYIGPVETNESGIQYVNIATPITDSTGGITGTLVARFDVAFLWDQVVNLRVGETGYTYLVDSNGQILTAKNLELVQNEANIKDLVGHSPESIVNGTFLGLFNMYTGIEGRRVVASANELTVFPWYAITEQPHTEALGDFVPFFVILAIALIVLIALIYSIGRYIRRNVIAPLSDISQGLQVFRSGNLDYEITPSGSQELRELSITINEIAHELNRSTAELAEANQTLEQRIAERSRDLSTLAQVTTQTATILEANQLLQSVVDMTKSNFGLYHAHVYLIDESGTTLTLAAGSGEVGKILVNQGHRIAIKSPRSLVASAARTQSVVTVNNVSSTPDFLPNPLLPQTQAELAAALVARGQLLGVLDVQSDVMGHFTPELQMVMRTLAQQIAAALSNARLYGDTERISRRELTLGAITEQMQSAVSVEDVLQTAVRELGKALRVPHTTISLQLSETPPGVDLPADKQVTPG
jgi:putative methionine-R-sulfoxide reductase with GAF domain